MRQPEPWYRAKRAAWYVQINKKQIKLGDDPNPKRDRADKEIPPREVMREYHRLMADSGLVSEVDRRKLPVKDVCDAFIETKKKMRASTQKIHKYWMAHFELHLRGRRFSDIRIPDVERIAELNPKWSSGTKYGFIRGVKGLFFWARQAGYIDWNPLAGFECPYAVPARTRGMTDEEFDALVAKARDLEFKQMMAFLRGTGARPGEAAIVAARHLHPDKPLVTLAPHEHKTGRRTGKDRVLVMPAEIEVTVRMLAKKHPTGPLFRNSRNGGPWKRVTLCTRIRNYRTSLGLGEDVVPYLIRHATLTRLLDHADIHLASKMAGHANSNTLQSTYYHPDVEEMMDVANKAHARKPKKNPGS